MLYYYHLFRFHISSNIHIRNRNNLDKSWKDLIEKRRRLRVVSGEKTMIQKIKGYFTKGQVTKGQVTKGQVTKGQVTKGQVTKD